MTAERWAQIKQVFDEALEQPASSRELFVLQVSNGDSELRDEALAMLRNSDEGGGLLDISLLGRQRVRPAALARTLNPGKTLAGRYRIVRPVGAGGMGEVYEAEDLEFGSRVAVKTMRMEDEDALARFKREIQLARTVTHPNVPRFRSSPASRSRIGQRGYLSHDGIRGRRGPVRLPWPPRRPHSGRGAGLCQADCGCTRRGA